MPFSVEFEQPVCERMTPMNTSLGRTKNRSQSAHLLRGRGNAARFSCARGRHPSMVADGCWLKAAKKLGLDVPWRHDFLDDPGQYLRAREAEAMCDHVWISRQGR